MDSAVYCVLVGHDADVAQICFQGEAAAGSEGGRPDGFRFQVFEPFDRRIRQHHQERAGVLIDLIERDEIAALLAHLQHRLGRRCPELSAAALNHLRGHGTGLRALNADVEAFGLEVAVLLGHGIEEDLLADADDRMHLHDRGLGGLLRQAARRKGRHREQQSRRQEAACAEHVNS